MVKSGQESIQPVDFQTRLHPQLPVEVIDTDELRRRVTPATFAAPQRLSFYALLLVHGDVGSHTVDFAEIPAREGRLIQIRPGQIQVWNMKQPIDATMVLSLPSVLSSPAWFPGHAAYCDLDSETLPQAEALVDSLRHQQNRFNGDGPTTRLMVALFDAAIALFDQARAETGDIVLPDVYVAFRNAIELDLGGSHHVVDYARSIGYSPRTVSRACEAATGLTAKGVLTDRLVLEAKRLLAHTDDPAAAISSRLGFSEPTNFAKFFTRNTSLRPSVFREQHRSILR